MGYDAPYSEERVLALRPEWGSGNGDGLGFGTLTFALDPIAAGQTPKGLTAAEKVTGNIELNWFGAPTPPRIIFTAPPASTARTV